MILYTKNSQSSVSQNTTRIYNKHITHMIVVDIHCVRSYTNTMCDYYIKTKHAEMKYCH